MCGQAEGDHHRCVSHLRSSQQEEGKARTHLLPFVRTLLGRSYACRHWLLLRTWSHDRAELQMGLGQKPPFEMTLCLTVQERTVGVGRLLVAGA